MPSHAAEAGHLPHATVVQDWFLPHGGSETVALELADLLPDSDVVTSFVDESYRPGLAGHRVRTWPLDHVGLARRRHRALLPLYPLWFESVDLRGYDLVVSSSSAFAKGVRTRRGAGHIAYIHTPMRFAWDLDGYLARSSVSVIGRLGAGALRPVLRSWDRRTAQRPDVLVANSGTVAARIRTVWGRAAEVIHPPVHFEDIEISTADDGYLLVAARLLAYRRIDLLVDAARMLDRELVVVGEGPEGRRLLAAAGPRTRFLGHVPRAELVNLLARCHAYVVPGEEDFGIAPVEAQAAGKPVIALRAGGALETVIEGQTGVYFDRQTPRALAEAIEHVDTMTADPRAIRANAERFAAPVFRRRFIELFRRLGVDPALFRADPA